MFLNLDNKNKKERIKTKNQKTKNKKLKNKINKQINLNHYLYK
jgi:hypothetical protein